MGIEQAAARVQEIRGMVSGIRDGVRPGTAPQQPHAGAFAATLQGALTAPPGGAPGAMPTNPAALLAQMQGGSTALGIEAMVAGAAPAAPAVPAAPSSRVIGDLEGLDPGLRAALDQVAEQLGKPIDVISGLRTRAEQEELYRRYKAGTGNLAAVPGTSRHESGHAADVYVDGVALANVPGARAAVAAAGLGFPVPGEAWHVEPVR